MRKRVFILLFSSLLGLALLLSPTPEASQAQGLLLVTFSPSEVQQGRTALINVFGPPDINAVVVTMGSQQTRLYQSVNGDWVGFLAADINAARGEQSVFINAQRADGSSYPLQTETLVIVWGSFSYQNLVLTGSTVNLLDPDLNRGEEDLLKRVYSRRTPQKLWSGEFQPPVPGGLISDFGGIRTYNDGLLEGRHTGVDYRAGTGEPAMAAAAGRVVFARLLPIRGNHVVIDHGLGVLTGYSHLSEFTVVAGQRVLPGDVIGLVGTTGRSQGAHMHFEMAVNGSWVDATQFMTLNIPEPRAQNPELSEGSDISG